MTVTVNQGQLAIGNRISAPSTLTWADLSSVSTGFGTWASWTRYNPLPGTISVTVTEDQETVSNRLPVLQIAWEGDLSVSLKVSDSIDSQGDLIAPTTYNLVFGTPVSITSGRYYEYEITVAVDSNTIEPTLTYPNIIFEDTRIEQFFESINTSTLSGTIDSRQLTTSVSTVTAIIATAREAGVTYSSGLLQDRVYAIPDNYVFQENAIVVNTVSLNPPRIRCFDLNGESIDAVVDIIVRGTEQIVLTLDGVVTL